MLFKLDPSFADVMAFLSKYKHWDLKTVNRNKQRVGYSCTIWGDGRRVTCQRKSATGAVHAAVNEIKNPPVRKRRKPGGPKLSVYSEGDSTDDDS